MMTIISILGAAIPVVGAGCYILGYLKGKDVQKNKQIKATLNKQSNDIRKAVEYKKTRTKNKSLGNDELNTRLSKYTRKTKD